MTGDAVVLDVQIAQLPVRAVGGDRLTVIFIALPPRPAAGRGDAAGSSTTRCPARSLVIFTVLALVGYPLVFETATRGRSLGKMAMGLRVVSDDGGPERFRQALFRALAAVIEIWVFAGGPAVICSLLSSKGKRIGDVFAGTVVISERGPKLEPPPVMPPALAWWASSLQLSGLRPGTGRTGPPIPFPGTQLDPAGARPDGLPDHRRCGRADLAAAAAGRAGRRVLAAVLAERHRRELMRLSPAPAPVAPEPVAPATAPPAGPPQGQPETGGFAPPG